MVPHYLDLPCLRRRLDCFFARCALRSSRLRARSASTSGRPATPSPASSGVGTGGAARSTGGSATATGAATCSGSGSAGSAGSPVRWRSTASIFATSLSSGKVGTLPIASIRRARRER